MLIVDPATGAMYRLNTPYIKEPLSQSTGMTEEKSLKIYNIDEIPENWKERLVKLKE